MNQNLLNLISASSNVIDSTVKVQQQGAFTFNNGSEINNIDMLINHIADFHVTVKLLKFDQELIKYAVDEKLSMIERMKKVGDIPEVEVENNEQSPGQ